VKLEAAHSDQPICASKTLFPTICLPATSWVQQVCAYKVRLNQKQTVKSGKTAIVHLLFLNLIQKLKKP